MPEIRCVLFDLGWTLVGPVSGDWTFTACFCRMFPKEQYGSFRNENWQAAFAKAYVPLQQNPGMKNVDEQIERYTVFYRDLIRFAGFAVSEEDARLLAVDISTNDHNMYLLETAEATLQTLKERGYRIGVISDTWPNIESQLAYLGIDSYFDQVSYSYRLGVLKPDPRIFQDAVDQSGMKPQELLFADDLGRNLAVARDMGMHVCQSLADPRDRADERFAHIGKPADILQYLP